MGGKKGVEQNRKYEKNRRDRLNKQFTELNKLLPDYDSSLVKVTKADIISRTIQFLNETRSKNLELGNEFENEKNKIKELQKKVASLLQIIKELIELLNKSNINFPSLLPVDDFVSFKEAFLKCKHKITEPSTDKKKKKKSCLGDETINTNNLSEIELSDSEPAIKKSQDTLIPTKQNTSVNEIPVTASTAHTSSTLTTNSQAIRTTQILNAEPAHLMRMNANSLVLPQTNLLTVNGTSNTFVNNGINPSPTILLNKQVAVPTLILMQNSVFPSTSVTHNTTLKPIIPKPPVNSTKTTFINKKPIPVIRLHKSLAPLKTEPSGKAQTSKHKCSRRSRGILVKYPKRRPPTKGKKKEVPPTKEISPVLPKKIAEPKKDENMNSFTSNLQQSSCNPVENTLSENTEDINKPYADNLFDTTSQFIDFFEPSRPNDNQTSYSGNSVSCEKEKVVSCFNDDDGGKVVESDKNLKYSSNEPLLLKYIPSSGSQTANSDETNEKQKTIEKDLTPLTIQCNLSEKFDDKNKNYESSFDDLFTSLQVPSSGQNTDSISPTAAFLLNFPLVSSCKNADLLPEQEEDSNTATPSSTTILQIGNVGSPSTLLFTNKTSREGKCTDKDETFTFGNSAQSVLPEPRDKKKVAKEMFSMDSFTNGQQTKNQMPFCPTSSNSSFPSYNIYTSPVTSSLYSLPSQPFPVAKTVDPITDFNSWMPSLYNQDDGKEKKRASFHTCSLSADVEKSKLKPKQNTSKPLVNWMTSPDLRNVEPQLQQQTFDVFSLPKEDGNFATACSSGDYFVDNQGYDSQMSGSKVTYSSTSYSWSPSKTSLPSIPLDPAHNMIIPSTLPTLVGDLALGGHSINSYDHVVSKKYDNDKKKNYKPQSQNNGSFLSVTQLVDDKASGKMKEQSESCHFEEIRDKGYKENYANISNTKIEFHKKIYSSDCKEIKSAGAAKCRKEMVKYNRCLPKENKKDNRHKSFEYPQNTCLQMVNKDQVVNKNSNYSAESLISSNNHSVFPSSTVQSCLSYDNSYSNCGTSKRPHEEEPITNIGYYTNTNYMPYNNFQTFNNYHGFSNQYCNNYSSQIQQPTSAGLQKKKNESICSKQDTGSDWLKDGVSYSSHVVSGGSSGEFDNNNQKDKCKQVFSNRYNYGQKSNAVNSSGVYNSYYHHHHHHHHPYPGHTSSSISHGKTSSCTFNCSYSSPFGQSEQQCSDVTCQTPATYDMKATSSVTRNSASNSNNLHSATTLTNFNLSTIFPEINEKHCGQPRINGVVNEKNGFKYRASKVHIDDMNYNYLMQSSAEINQESEAIYGPSGLQIAQFTDFTQRKSHKQ